MYVYIKSGYEEVAYLDTSTIRHKQCEVLLASDANDRCVHCATHR